MTYDSEPEESLPLMVVKWLKQQGHLKEISEGSGSESVKVESEEEDSMKAP